MGEVTAYLGLGANLGEREATLAQALNILHEYPTIKITKISSLYETEPMGFTEQPTFLNMVAEARTSLNQDGLLAAALAIEQELGRVRTKRWGPRVIDIDVLLYGDLQFHSAALTVPHPRLAERAFVLIPLAEIAPGLVLPGLGITVKKLLETGNITGQGVVRRKNSLCPFPFSP